jgi:DNA (cytosine-5)-methyltransferase 1
MVAAIFHCRSMARYVRCELNGTTITSNAKNDMSKTLTFVDLFAGIGGIRMGFESAGCRCVRSNDNNRFCEQTYAENFGSSDFVSADIRELSSWQLPDFNILCAGFPCQPFSAAGVSKKKSLGQPHGFEDETQGTLFHEIVRIIKDKQPQAFFLENVKNLEKHDRGRTFAVVQRKLNSLGYSFFPRIINARLLVPQNRERIYMVGFRDNTLDFVFPDISDSKPCIADILDDHVDDKYTISDHLKQYFIDYAEKHRTRGNGFGFGLVERDGCSRTLSARYGKDGSEILIPQDGMNPRRLTPRECARLQGFPDSFQIPVSDSQAYKQFGNSVVVPVIARLALAMVQTLSGQPQSDTPDLVQKRLGFYP